MIEKDLKIVVGRPPIWAEAHKHFKLDDEKTVYTYGETIYNPGNNPIDEPLMAHELTHSIQQRDTEGGPAGWWKKYFEDPKFRLEQELEAYKKQYSIFCEKRHDRNVRARFLWTIAGDASGPMYEAGISRTDAMTAIKGNK